MANQLPQKPVGRMHTIFGLRINCRQFKNKINLIKCHIVITEECKYCAYKHWSQKMNPLVYEIKNGNILIFILISIIFFFFRNKTKKKMEVDRKFFCLTAFRTIDIARPDDIYIFLLILHLNTNV